jgi:hypothetical protein
MISSSINVLTKPSVATFEQYERRGTVRDAFVYMIAAGLLAGIVGLLFGLINGVTGALVGFVAGAIIPIIGFAVFASVLYFMGKQQGGTGTQDEVFYTCALYTAPLLAITGVIGAIPLLNCLLLPATFLLGLYQLYLGYLASRSSMNLDQTKAIISVVVAIIAQIIVGAIITALLITPFAINAANQP